MDQCNGDIGQLERGGNGLDECREHVLGRHDQGKLLIQTCEYLVGSVTLPVHQPIDRASSAATHGLEDNGHESSSDERNQRDIRRLEQCADITDDQDIQANHTSHQHAIDQCAVDDEIDISSSIAENGGPNRETKTEDKEKRDGKEQEQHR